MTGLRLVADDLTGALDTAAELMPLAGPVPVYWAAVLPANLPPTCAVDSGTREQDLGSAVAALECLAPALAAATLSYKKVDSLLRGHAMAELAACWRLGAWDHCIVAPAFPFQGRVTIDSVQKVRRSDAWEVVADVLALLAEAGIDASRRGQTRALAPGVTVFDATTDEDLAGIAALGRAAAGRVLWCGSAGLAQALVGRNGVAPPPSLSGRVLGLFGSDQAVTARQLEACGDAWLRLSPGGAVRHALAIRLGHGGAVMVSLELSTGLSRAEAARRIAETFTELVQSVEPPDVLLVAGGETLRGLCDALGTQWLEVRGQFEPGLPHSVMRGGLWDGVTVVSKSGAFGGPTLWRDLLTAHGHQIADSTQQHGPAAEKVEV